MVFGTQLNQDPLFTLAAPVFTTCTFCAQHTTMVTGCDRDICVLTCWQDSGIEGENLCYMMA